MCGQKSSTSQVFNFYGLGVPHQYEINIELEFCFCITVLVRLNSFPLVSTNYDNLGKKLHFTIFIK